MKRILLIGQNSYLSKQLKTHLLTKSKGYMVNAISALSEQWQALPFGLYDWIIDLEAVTPWQEEDAPSPSPEAYFQVNRDLARDLARKAKEEGCTHFLYISTIEVYGFEPRAGKTIQIEKNTPCRPITDYGKSKLAGEDAIKELEGDGFQAAILRLPMVYGPGCPGEYEAFRKLAASGCKLPSMAGQKSAIHISTLCAFVQYLIEQTLSGTLHPQNKDYLSPLELLHLAAKEEDAQIRTSWLTGLKYRLFPGSVPKEIHQVFGGLVYGKEIDLG